MKKFFSLVAALLAVSLVSFGFIVSSDDDDDGPSAVATYKATVEGYPYTLKMFSDKTWTYTISEGKFTFATIEFTKQ